MPTRVFTGLSAGTSPTGTSTELQPPSFSSLKRASVGRSSSNKFVISVSRPSVVQPGVFVFVK